MTERARAAAETQIFNLLKRHHILVGQRLLAELSSLVADAVAQAVADKTDQAIQDMQDELMQQAEEIAELRAREADTWERVKRLEQEEVPRLRAALAAATGGQT